MGRVKYKTRIEIDNERLINWRQTAKVSAFQAHQALEDKGHMAAVEAIMDHPDTPKKTVRAFNMAQVFKRTSPTILDLAAQLGLDDAQLDDLFEYAATIEA